MKFFAFLTFAMAAMTSVRAVAVSSRKEFPERQLLDLCVFLDAPIDLTIAGVVYDFDFVGVCLCLSALPLFIETNAVAIVAAGVAGVADVLAALTALITTGGYPICLPGASARVKRDVAFIDAQCPKGLTLCGVQSSWSRTAWECVDTARDLESCGGCTVGILGHHASGQDCTSIAEVEDVACNRGRCEVLSCRFGFKPSADGSMCLAIEEALNESYGIHHYANAYLDSQDN